MLWLPFSCLFLVALAAALAFTPAARFIAIWAKAIDYPSKRRINARPVPRMGGIAIFVALIVAALMQYLGTSEWGWPVVLVPSALLNVNYYGLAASFTLIFLVGVIDDVLTLKPLPKLMGQTVASVVAVASGLVIGNVTNPFGASNIVLGWLAYPITVVYLVAFANIINLIDGLDGLASGVSCISAFTMFVLAFNAGRLDAAAIAIALCGATLGFLRYNFYPASIFLGDSGSLLLGFALGAISLLSVTRIAGLTTLIIPLVLAGIPIIDTFSAIIRRSRAHISPTHADAGHIHHRLMQEGYNQRQAVIIIWIWTAFLCLGAVIMTQVQVQIRVLVFLLLLVVSGAFAIHLKLFKPVLLHHYTASGQDTLITPDDPAFKEEAERQNIGHTKFEAAEKSLSGKVGIHKGRFEKTEDDKVFLEKSESQGNKKENGGA